MGLQAFTLAVVVILAVAISFPLVFFGLLLQKVLLDKMFRQIINQVPREEVLKSVGAEVDGGDTAIKAPPKVLLSFRQVIFSQPKRNGTEELILHGVSGFFEPATMTAIMGPSGTSDKTTLLDILADQKLYGTIVGDIRVNGRPCTNLFRRATAYVMKTNVLYPQLTPRETFYFVAELRLSEKVPAKRKYMMVDKTLNDLDLAHVADTRIGESDEGLSGISGGQRRRVTVGIELVTNPGLLLLDEPTSGLDAFGSLKLIQVLRKLSDQGRTIATTIHQPRSEVFNLFDRLLLLQAGSTVYFGPTQGILTYFTNIGVPVDYSINPADFVVDLTQEKTDEDIEVEKDFWNKMRQAAANDDDRKEQFDQLFRNQMKGEDKTSGGDSDAVPDLVSQWTESRQKRIEMKKLFQISIGTYEHLPEPLEDVYHHDDPNDGELGDHKNEDGKDQFATPFLKQVLTIGGRAVLNDIRNSAYMIGNWVIGPVMMLFYGALYSNVPEGANFNVDDLEKGLEQLGACNLNDTQLALYSPSTSTVSLVSCGNTLNSDEQLAFVRASLIYQLMAAAYFSEAPYVSQVFLDKQSFFREYNAKSYSAAAYHFAWYMRMFFAAFCKGVFFVPLGYFSAQLEFNAESYFLFCIFFGAMSACGASIALVCSSLLPGLELAQGTYVLVNILAQNLSGYWLVEPYIPPWFIWLYYINFFRYAFEGAVLGQALDGRLNDGESSIRARAWLFALVCLIFAAVFQLIAFLGTFLSQRTTSTGPRGRAPDDMETAFSDEETFNDSLSELSAETADSKLKGGEKRQTLLDQYRELQHQSMQNVNAQSTSSYQYVGASALPSLHSLVDVNAEEGPHQNDEDEENLT